VQVDYDIKYDTMQQPPLQSKRHLTKKKYQNENIYYYLIN